MAALKCFWRGYVELFGSFDEMIIIFQVRNFINPDLPIVSLEEQRKSPSIDAILETLRTIIDQCKAEGVFDPNLNSELATRLLLLMFSNCVDNAIRMPPEVRKSPALTEEMTKTFQIIIRGFAKEGIKYSSLDITSQ